MRGWQPGPPAWTGPGLDVGGGKSLIWQGTERAREEEKGRRRAGIGLLGIMNGLASLL